MMVRIRLEFEYATGEGETIESEHLYWSAQAEAIVESFFPVNTHVAAVAVTPV